MTWLEAKQLGLVRYSTGVPCRRGHVVERYVSNRACLTCVKMSIDRQDRGVRYDWKTNHARTVRQREKLSGKVPTET